MTYKDNLAGVFPPMVTPFDSDEILFSDLAENVRKYNKTGLRGYFVLGTNGEFKSLSVKERLQVLKTVVENSAEDKIVMAGTAAESTKQSIDITLEAAKIGVDQVSLLMPHFFKKYMTDEVITDYITDVADKSPVPVVLYNNPSVASGVLISVEVIKRVSSHPNVIGMKDSSKNNYQDYIAVTQNEDFHLIAGSASFFYDVLKAGGVGGVLSLSNVFPEECVKLYNLFQEGKTEQAEIQNNKLVSLNKKVSGFKGVAAVKGAMELVGFKGGTPRRPLKGLSKKEEKELKINIREKGFLGENK